jgi:hypothetical protein
MGGGLHIAYVTDSPKAGQRLGADSEESQSKVDKSN